MDFLIFVFLLDWDAAYCELFEFCDLDDFLPVIFFVWLVVRQISRFMAGKFGLVDRQAADSLV